MEDNKLAIRFQGRLVVYDEESAKDIRLAYAITVHKSQGSEFPVVIIPLSMSHFIMLRKNLIYTALTRGKKLVILIGSEKAFAYSIKNQKGLKRQTQLMSLIKSNLNKAD